MWSMSLLQAEIKSLRCSRNKDYKCPRYLKTFSSQTHLAHFSHWRQTTHKSPNPREKLHAGVDSEQDLTTFKCHLEPWAANYRD